MILYFIMNGLVQEEVHHVGNVMWSHTGWRIPWTVLRCAVWLRAVVAKLASAAQSKCGPYLDNVIPFFLGAIQNPSHLGDRDILGSHSCCLVFQKTILYDVQADATAHSIPIPYWGGLWMEPNLNRNVHLMGPLTDITDMTPDLLPGTGSITRSIP